MSFLDRDEMRCQEKIHPERKAHLPHAPFHRVIDRSQQRAFWALLDAIMY